MVVPIKLFSTDMTELQQVGLCQLVFICKLAQSACWFQYLNAMDIWIGVIVDVLEVSWVLKA